MKTKLILTAAVVGWVCAGAAAEDYDFYAGLHILAPDQPSAGTGGRKVVWSHPAFANRCIYVRNDHEILCVSLAAPSR